jgi:nucleoid DNA-binding protein
MHVIPEYIGDFLLRQDNVIVSDLGAFIARRIPARLSEDGGKIYPPYKQLLFHPNLNLSDGLFERYVASRSQCSLDEAIQSIAKTVATWQTNLKQGERVEIEKVGFLYIDKEHRIRFEQDRTYNLLLSSYGIGEIVFEKTNAHVQTKDAVKKVPSTHELDYFELAPEKNLKITQIEPKEENDHKVVLTLDGVSKSNDTRSIWIKVAAAAVIMPFVFYSFWVPLTTDVLHTKKVAFSDFNPFNHTTQPIYKNTKLSAQLNGNEVPQDLEDIVRSLPEDAQFYNFNYDEELVIPVRLERRRAPLNSTFSTEKTKSILSKTYNNQTKHLITGCFSLKENAEKHVVFLLSLGFQAYLVPHQSGLFKVSAFRIVNEQDMFNVSAKLKQKGIDFWILND